MSRRFCTMMIILTLVAGSSIYLYADCCDDDGCANGNMCNGGASRVSGCNWQFTVAYDYSEYAGQEVWFHIRSNGGGWDDHKMDPVPVVVPPCKWFFYNYTLTANTDYEYYFSSGGYNYPAGTMGCPHFALCVDDGCDREPY